MHAYTLALFVHVAAAVLLLGTSLLTEPAVRAAARRSGSAGELRALLDLGRWLAPVSPVSGLLVLATGVYLTSVGEVWTRAWVQASIAAWLISTFCAAALVKPAVARLAARASGTTDGPVSQELDALRWSGAWTRGVDVKAATDAAVLFLMMVKPTTLGASILSIVGAIAAVGGARTLLRFHRPAARPAVSPGA